MFRNWSLRKCVISPFGCRSINNHPSGYLGMVAYVENIPWLRIDLLIVVAITAMVDFPTRTDLADVGVRWCLPSSVSDWVLLGWVWQRNGMRW